MWNELMRKWFGLSSPSCSSCEILRDQLDKSEEERKELLHRLLDKDKPEPPQVVDPTLKPLQPQFIPWRVRQQMLEQEDRKRAQLMKDRTKEINELEKELGVEDARQVT